MNIVEMRVHMDCAGCENKIRKALHKIDGVDNVDMDITMQKVTVMGWADQEKVLKTVGKTGCIAELWPYPYNPEYHNFVHHYYHQHPYGDDHDHQIHAYMNAYATLPSSNSCNYGNHGYNDDGDYGYYQQAPSSTIIDHEASSIFSDDNAHACSII